MRPTLGQKGFTLLELIVSLAIIGMIVGIALGGIRLATASRETGELKTDTSQRLRFISEQLVQKFHSLHPYFFDPELMLASGVFGPPPAPAPAAPEPQPPEKIKILAFEGTPTDLHFITYADPLTAVNSVEDFFHEIRVYLGKHPLTEESGIVLVERTVTWENVFMPPDPQDPETHFTLLAKNAAYLKFRYYMVMRIPEAELQDLMKQLQPGQIPPRFKSFWTDNAPLQYIEQLVAAKPADPTQAPPLDDSKISVPRAIEMSVGLIEENEKKGSDSEPEVFSLPPTIIPIHSGTEWVRMHFEASDATAQ